MNKLGELKDLFDCLPDEFAFIRNKEAHLMWAFFFFLENTLAYLRIEDLTMPGKTPSYSPRGGGWESVEQMQNELINRQGNRWLTDDPRYFNIRVLDKIPNGVIIWKFNDARGCWLEEQKVTLENQNEIF